MDQQKPKAPESAFSRQVGGDHYKGFAIQPMEFSIKNKLSFVQGEVVKRICRYNLPGGKGVEDLRKIQHEIDLLIEAEKWEGENLGCTNPLNNISGSFEEYVNEEAERLRNNLAPEPLNPFDIIRKVTAVPSEVYR